MSWSQYGHAACEKLAGIEQGSSSQVRARTFYAEKTGTNVSDVDVPVIGGHAGVTILPLFSQATPSPSSLSAEQIDALTKRTQDGGTEVVQAKAGKVGQADAQQPIWRSRLYDVCTCSDMVCLLQGSATLSMAYAGALFADACLRGLNGEPDVEEYSYVESDKTELPFFSTKVKLGKAGEWCSSNSCIHLFHPQQSVPIGAHAFYAGIQQIYDIPSDLTDYEKEALAGAIPELKGSIQKGIDFAHQA